MESSAVERAIADAKCKRRCATRQPVFGAFLCLRAPSVPEAGWRPIAMRPPRPDPPKWDNEQLLPRAVLHWTRCRF